MLAKIASLCRFRQMMVRLRKWVQPTRHLPLRHLHSHRDHDTDNTTYQPRSIQPTVRTLEPRFVLNATAELTAIGELLLTGDAAADSINLNELADGSLSITDATGAVIPIANHPGAVGDPLPVAAVTAGRVRIDLGGGNDVLNLDLPAGLDVTVVDSEGDDQINVRFSALAEAIAANKITVAAETITFGDGDTNISFGNDDVSANGHVRLGTIGTTTSIALGTGDFVVAGSLELSGDVSLFANGGEIDWSNASLSTSQTGTDVLFRLSDTTSADLTLGVVNDSAGEKIESINIIAATSVVFAGDVDLTESLTAQGVTSDLSIDAEITASEIQLRSDGKLVVNANLNTTDSLLLLQSNQSVVVSASVDTTAAMTAGQITLIAPDLQLSSAELNSAGADIALIGNTRINGTVSIDSGNAAIDAGNIQAFGIVSGNDQIDDRLTIRSTGQTNHGNVEIQGAIGNPSDATNAFDLNELLIDAEAINLQAVGITGGPLRLNASTIRLSEIPGTETQWTIRSSGTATGDAIIDGQLILPVRDTRIITDGDLTFGGPIVGQTGSESLTIDVGGNVRFESTVSNTDELIVASDGSVTFNDDIDLQGRLNASADDGIKVFAASIATAQETVFRDDAVFGADIELNASNLRFDSRIVALAGITVTALAPILDPASSDPVATSSVIKAGEGTLILAADNSYTAETLVESGTLFLRGSLGPGAAQVTVAADATLAGFGTLDADLLVMNGGRLQLVDATGTNTTALSTQSIELQAGAIYEVQLNGPTAGSQFDQLVIGESTSADETVSIEGAILDLQLNHSPSPATEFVIVRNDGVDEIDGHFSVNFDTSGNALAAPRVLGEGDLVLEPFGDQAQSAFITYFGGDGNDIAIVAGGDVSLDADQVTLIVRRGVDLEIRTGNDLAQAQAATPTVRPIAGLNDNRLILADTAGDDVIFLDANALVNTDGNSISFVGNIQFDGDASFDDNDQIVFFDSAPSTNDLPTEIVYEVADDRAGNATIRFGSAGYSVTFTGLESFDQTITSDQTQIVYSDSDQQIQIDADPLASQRTQFIGTSGATATTQLSLNNSPESLTLLTGDGDDQIQVNGFGYGANGFDAALTIDGQSGDDLVTIDTALTLGSDRSTGELVIEAETIAINGDIDTTLGPTDGSVQITGGTRVVITADATLATGEGQIKIDGGAGGVDTTQSNLISHFDGDAIVITNATSVALGNIEAPLGRFVLGDSADIIGPVTQDTTTSIKVERLFVSTADTVDLANDNNEIGAIDQIQSGGGVIVVDATGDLTVGGVDSSGSDVQIRSQGSIALQKESIVATGGTIWVNAGQAIIDLEADDSRPNLSARVIHLTAGTQGIGQATNAIDAVATESIHATTGIFDGNIFLSNLAGDLPVGLIDAGTGNVTLTANAINDATDDAATDVIAKDLTLTATAGIGSESRLEIQDVDRLTAVTTTGGIDLDWAANSATLIDQASTDSGFIRIEQVGQQRMEIGQVDNAAGSITITNNDQSIDVIGSGTAIAVQAGQGGTIDLIAAGNDSDVFVRSGIASDSGDIGIRADRNAVFSADGDITSTSGDLAITSDNRDGNFAGVISMNDGTVFDVGVGRITFNADGDIGLGGLATTNNTGDAVTILSESGRITDRGDTHLDIDAANGVTRLASRNGIGEMNAIETTLSTLDAQVTATGAIQIHETNAIVLRDLRTNDGLIDVVAGGTITATDLQSQNTSDFDDGTQQAGNSSRDIQLTATNATSDILVDRIIAERSADVILIAQDDVIDIDAGDERLIRSDDLRVRAANQSDDQATAIQLTTNVNDADVVVTGDSRGDLELREIDSINLAASDSSDDTETIATSNGEIRITAGETIRVDDLNLVDDSADLLSDVEIIAGGENGRISIRSGESIELTDRVQLGASQSTAEAVFIESVAVTLGEQFQISTGQGIGVARIFAPRPEARLVDTAFFESTSVSTNILEQAAINDAEGKLTVDIGNEGERGLTINIDWGAQTNRFQQIDGLSGDAAPLVVSHVYLEEDILESRLNGRTSETAPLNVKFSVRHHESIRVIGDTIAQGESDILPVDGRVLSSTDNPLTQENIQSAILENGNAQFIIPNLSIPVAFFPVRDVIPELSEPEVFVQPQQTVSLNQGGFTLAETSVSTSLAREEYFQIRVLSPDPQADDLAPPEQLPEDILDGNKLRDLFSRLPDGRYEIEYVLGDGNERSILQVDLRGGRPIIPTDDLDGGTLRLREVGDETQDASDVDAGDLQPDEIDRLRKTLERQKDELSPPNASPPLGLLKDSADPQSGIPGDSTKMELLPLAATVIGATTVGQQTTNYFSAGKRFFRRSTIPRS